ncbi:hypothetical protein JRQ81_019603, partial [Phrynocephalus forsythii]
MAKHLKSQVRKAAMDRAISVSSYEHVPLSYTFKPVKCNFNSSNNTLLSAIPAGFILNGQEYSPELRTNLSNGVVEINHLSIQMITSYGCTDLYTSENKKFLIMVTLGETLSTYLCNYNSYHRRPNCAKALCLEMTFCETGKKFVYVEPPRRVKEVLEEELYFRRDECRVKHPSEVALEGIWSLRRNFPVGAFQPTVQNPSSLLSQPKYYSRHAVVR